METRNGGPPEATVGGSAEDALVEAAYLRYRQPIFAQLMASARDEATAQDLCQEAFLRLTVQVRSGAVPDDVGAWLRRVAANLAISRGRRQTVAQRKAERLVEPDAGPSPEEEVVRRERQVAVRAALRELGEVDRSAVLMAAQGYGGPEIARSLGRSQTATRTLLSRARARLRQRLVLAGMQA
jgi:RNA polymerase sigma-70 factor (ECF subfamily)